MDAVLLDYQGVDTLAEPEDLVKRATDVALAFEALGFGDEWKAEGETGRRRLAKRFCFLRWLNQHGRIGHQYPREPDADPIARLPLALPALPLARPRGARLSMEPVGLDDEVNR